MEIDTVSPPGAWEEELSRLPHKAIREEKLRQAARDQPCVRCGRVGNGTVLAHYTGARRGSYGGGFGLKVHDLLGAHLCAECHHHMDTGSRSKEGRWEHSEEFQHYILLTLVNLWHRGVIR